MNTWKPTQAEIITERGKSGERATEKTRVAEEASDGIRRRIENAAPSDATHWRYLEATGVTLNEQTGLVKLSHRVTYAELPNGHGLEDWTLLGPSGNSTRSTTRPVDGS